ncbi:zinc-dependent metalloprotease [Chitinophaga sp. Cy-1792]|uniref:zinc-dependent metalloprotease n=1 Tax=Chitinophaga sp. Cy-1792 TaxID=2608339 RepID=UPI00141F5279|nr:zinc-dependent metalloprotease [Chitinophaga sp. Cy-1792]NIG53558.1 zinc-dependent metalloprotease [Chitinophaga sp. Cy-1792]
MKRYTYISLAALMASCAVFKGGRKKKATPAPAAIAVPAKPVSKNGVKPYDQVITKNLVSTKGLFTVHTTKELDTTFFEIPANLLGRDILAVSRITGNPALLNIFPGEELDTKAITFEKGPNETITLREKLYVYKSDSSNVMSHAVADLIEAVAYTFPIKAYGKDSASFVLDMSKYIVEPTSIFNTISANKLKDSIAPTLTKNVQLTREHIYPENIELGTSKIYVNKKDNNQEYNLEANTSLLLLPEKPMTARYIDPRIGYFNTGWIEFGDDQQRAQSRKVARRWRLEPKPEDLARYNNGELVEPAKQIVYYIDPATPKKWRPYLIKGVNDWQKAFEQAGFKNAIVAKEWPEGDTTMHMDDIRYSFINYFPSEVANAYGPNIIDPRSGEIIQTHIGWYHNIMTVLRNWYMIQAGPNDPKAQHVVFDDELMGQLIRFVSSHEVGHTLGLMHNFGNSSMTPVDSLRSISYLRKHGHTGSIMDYARFNYVAQPEDNIPQELLFPRIGEYDQWAIEWGYKYTGKTAAEDKTSLFNLTTSRLANNPRLWFGEGQLRKIDPRCQTEDLGDDAAKAGSYGILNLKRVMEHLPEWTYEEGANQDAMTEVYQQIQEQFFRYMNHALQYVGTLTYTPKPSNDTTMVMEPVPVAKQLAVLEFYNKELFTTPTWLLNPKVTDVANRPAELNTEFIADLQARVLNSLLDYEHMVYQQANYDRFEGNSLGVDKLVSVLHNDIWKELKGSDVKMDGYRRDLQKVYVGAVLDALTGKRSANGESDVNSLMLLEVSTLKAEITKAIPHAADPLNKAHLVYLAERIEKFEHKNKG